MDKEKEEKDKSLVKFVWDYLRAWALLLLFLYALFALGDESWSFKEIIADCVEYYYEKKLDWSLSDSEDVVEDYQKACKKQKWDEAYSAIETFRAERDRAEATYKIIYGDFTRGIFKSRAKLYEDALHYVTLKESLWVLEQNGINGIPRIVSIAKEHNVEGWLYEQLVDVSYEIGDEALIEKMEQLFVGQVCNYRNVSAQDSDKELDEVNAIVEKIRRRRDNCFLDDRKAYWDELYEEAVRFVVLKKGAALLEKMQYNLSYKYSIDKEKTQLVLLAKEHDAESWLYDELIDFANKSGKKTLLKHLRSMK